MKPNRNKNKIILKPREHSVYISQENVLQYPLI